MENASRKFDPLWPTATTTLLRQTCSPTDAVISDWPPERLYRMIQGYREAADSLVTEAASHSHVRDRFIYPVVFLYRQSFELHLKHFLMTYGPIAGVKPDFRTHGLTKLWDRCMEIIDVLMKDLIADDTTTCQIVGRLIRELDVVDPLAQALRYAHDTQGNPINIPMQSLDLENLRAVFAGVSEFLECVEWSLLYDYGIESRISQ